MNIDELRVITQHPRREYDTWYGKHVCRKLSIYITWLFLKLNISPHIATLIFSVTGVISCVSFAVGGKLSFIIGALLLQLWYLLDHVDGEIARYIDKVTISGIFFDKIGHYIVHPLVFLSIGLGAYNDLGIKLALPLSFIAALSVNMIGLIEELEYSTLYKAGVSSRPGQDGGMKDKKSPGFLKSVFSLAHKACIYPNIMNIISISAVVNIFLNIRIPYYLLAAYALLASLVWVCQLVHILVTKKLDLYSADYKQGR